MPVGDFEFTPGQNSNHHSRESSSAMNRPKPIHFNGGGGHGMISNGNSYYGSQYSPSYADLNSPSRRNDIDTPTQNSTFVFSNENRSVKNK